MLQRAWKEVEALERVLTIFDRLLEAEDVGIVRLADELGYEHEQVRYGLRVLEEEGLIEPSANGPTVTADAEQVRAIDERLDAVAGDFQEMPLRTNGGTSGGDGGGYVVDSPPEFAGDVVEADTPREAARSVVDRVDGDDGTTVEVAVESRATGETSEYVGAFRASRVGDVTTASGLTVYRGGDSAGRADADLTVEELDDLGNDPAALADHVDAVATAVADRDPEVRDAALEAIDDAADDLPAETRARLVAPVVAQVERELVVDGDRATAGESLQTSVLSAAVGTLRNLLDEVEESTAADAAIPLVQVLAYSYDVAPVTFSIATEAVGDVADGDDVLAALGAATSDLVAAVVEATEASALAPTSHGAASAISLLALSVPTVAATADEAFRPGVRHPDVDVRRAVVDTIGGVADSEASLSPVAADAVGVALGDETAEVREAAVEVAVERGVLPDGDLDELRDRVRRIAAESDEEETRERADQLLATLDERPDRPSDAADDDPAESDDRSGGESFERGQEVVLRDEHSEFDGEVGTVSLVETLFGDATYTVDFDDGSETGVPAADLDPAGTATVAGDSDAESDDASSEADADSTSEPGATEAKMDPDSTSEPEATEAKTDVGPSPEQTVDPSDRVPETVPTVDLGELDASAFTTGEIVGRGGNADIYRARVTVDAGPETVAIKEPRFAGTVDRTEIERVIDEAEVWDRVDDHDHVTTVVDWGVADGVPWIAMEYMEGGNLAQRLDADDLSLPERCWIALSIAEAVAHAHRFGIAHLDLKPANVLFRRVDDGWDVPKIADWGLSRALARHSNTVDGVSPSYAAPEQFDPGEYGEIGPATDVYQLGVVIHELFTGETPFSGGSAEVLRGTFEEEPTPPSQVADVPAGLDDVVTTALAKRQSERYEHVLYLRDDLRDVWQSMSEPTASH